MAAVALYFSSKKTKQKWLITFWIKQRYAVYCCYCMLGARYGKNCEIYEYNWDTCCRMEQTLLFSQPAVAIFSL